MSNMTVTREQLEAFAEANDLTFEQAEKVCERMFKRAEYRLLYNKRPDRVAKRKEYNRERSAQERELRRFVKGR